MIPSPLFTRKICPAGFLIWLVAGLFAPINAQNATDEQYVVTVRDQLGRPVADADLDLSPCGLGVWNTGSDGSAQFSLPARANCYLTVHKAGLQDLIVAIRWADSHTISVIMSNDRSSPFSGTVYEAGTGVPMRYATVYARNSDGTHITRTTTDVSGNYTLHLNPQQEYTLIIAQNACNDVRTQLRTGPAIAGTQTIPPAQLSPGLSDLMSWLYKNPSGIPRHVAVEPFRTGASTGFGIQIASGRTEFSDPGDTYVELADYGKFYSKKEGGMYKLRLGMFRTREEAQAVVDQIAPTFPVSYVTPESGFSEKMFIGYTSSAASSPATAKATLVAPQAAVLPDTPTPAEKKVTVFRTMTPAPSTAPAQYSTPSTMTAKGQPSGASVQYAVQVGSFATERPFGMNDFSGLNGLGHLYGKPENGLFKVRLGIWADYSQAEAIRAEALARGFQDATIITEKTDDADVQPYFFNDVNAAAPILSAPMEPAQYSAPSEPPATEPSFYVRIAALSNPDRFDPTPYQELGNIEMRPLANGMTLILLGRYLTSEDALAVQKELRRRGDSVPYAVKDEGGKLEKL